MSSAGSQDGHKSGNKTRTETIVDDDKTDYENAKWSDMTRGERLKYAVGKYGMYTLVGGTFAYIISKSSMWLTGTFMGLSFKTVGWWGFVTGYWAGIATTAALYSVTRGLYIRPENVRNKAFQLVSGSARVQSLMGLSMLHPLKAGVMRAYSMDGGAIELDRATRRIVWRQPRVKMLFQVYGGQSHQAVVCAEAVRTWQGLNFDFVSVDFLTIPSEPPILVHGDPKRFSVEGQLRDLVQLKKSYV